MRLLSTLMGKKLMGRKLFLGCLMIGWLSSCSSVEVTDYKDTTPTLVLESFFNGPLKASGVVHDFSGKVIRKFNVTMEANWQGNEGVINEWFVYNDGETQTRVWKIKALGNGQYTGTAGDILGTALGQSSGSALRWKYDMLLPVDGDEYQVHFDDWMFLVNDNTIINQSDIIKFGVTVAQVTLIIQK
ncbi:DUF3833 domain-containing protein [Shewanella glacialipiscicola]|uniref:DUF3833 domain-containing protein n=1 Tax=Shewanella glacialipiscicola TaxID=614069 RepID=UPI0021D84195|nr:DUF3833 domain-containing protein [Shewanella glacialipiscicola]MCU7993983.1 DUF3833 domain-containing protein [Shewanella glacialipiscicola]MCU8025301.1 DUF3833 domain-containing protein [Shewanella glacialipiscicola]